MANEISISAVTGLTPTMQLYSGTSPVGAVINFTEITGTGVYIGSVPANTPYGQYIGIAFAAANVVLASGQLLWDGDYELPIGLATVQGLDPNNPAMTTQTQLTAGAIQIAITGDQVTNTEFTRTA